MSQDQSIDVLSRDRQRESSLDRPRRNNIYALSSAANPNSILVSEINTFFLINVIVSVVSFSTSMSYTTGTFRLAVVERFLRFSPCLNTAVLLRNRNSQVTR